MTEINFIKLSLENKKNNKPNLQYICTSYENHKSELLNKTKVILNKMLLLHSRKRDFTEIESLNIYDLYTNALTSDRKCLRPYFLNQIKLCSNNGRLVATVNKNTIFSFSSHITLGGLERVICEICNLPEEIIKQCNFSISFTNKTSYAVTKSMRELQDNLTEVANKIKQIDLIIADTIRKINIEAYSLESIMKEFKITSFLVTSSFLRMLSNREEIKNKIGSLVFSKSNFGGYAYKVELYITSDGDSAFKYAEVQGPGVNDNLNILLFLFYLSFFIKDNTPANIKIKYDR